MRIRKNASRILGSSSSSSPAAAATPLLLPPPQPAPELLQKCELNQSPWDVMSFPLPPSSPQKMGNDGDDGLERDVSMKSITRSNKKRAVSRKKEAADHKGSTVPTCKKMDGKRWKCKKAAQLPHTLCDYHLTHLKSYSTDNVPSSQDHRPKSKKRQKVSSAAAAAAAGLDSGFYYYYSGFGPWRGKKRGGSSGGGNMNGTAETVKEEGQEDHEKEEDLQENADDDEDSLDEQSEEEEAKQQQQQQQKNNPRRRRRRKARSLKSLL